MEECRKRGYEALFVLGDPAYYGRFGFRTASDWGIRCEYYVPDEAFMALELKEGALAFICVWKAPIILVFLMV